MAYVDPPTFASDTVLTAADLNILGEDIRTLKAAVDGTVFCGVDLSITSPVSIADSSTAALDWDAENFDYGSWWSTGTDITVPAIAVPAGFTTTALDCFANVRFVPDGSSGRSLTINVNGSEAARTSVRISDSDYCIVFLSQPIIVEAGDVITVVPSQNSGGALDIDSARIQLIRRVPVA